VRRILDQSLERNRYTVLHDVHLPAGGGSHRIGHVVVSRFGIFVIDGIQVRGVISGSAVQDRWKQRSMGRTKRLDNPVHRNRVHADSIASGFGVRPAAVHGLVVLDGVHHFHNQVPEQVVTPERLIARIRRHGQQMLEAEQADALLHEILKARLPAARPSLLRRQGFLVAVLTVVLIAGLYLAYADDVREYMGQRTLEAEQRADPSAFHPDGRRKTERERWEDSLRCAWSPDTKRCACYEPDGKRAEIDAGRCRELAERGSILTQ
jgi:hypothetical protein